jgi:hypothetical protein
MNIISLIKSEKVVFRFSGSLRNVPAIDNRCVGETMARLLEEHFVRVFKLHLSWPMRHPLEATMRSPATQI